MGSLNTQHTSDKLGRGLSGIIWGDCPFNEIRNDPSVGWGIQSDFISFGGLLTSTAGNYHADGCSGFKSFQDSGGTITQVSHAATQSPGVIKFNQDGTSNDAVTMECGFGTGGMFTITQGQKLFFECRFQTSSIAASTNNIFIGLVAPGSTASTGALITDSDALVATSSGVSLVGFNSLVAAPTAMTTVYGTAAATATVHSASALTMAASTWYKVGFKFDGNYLHYYVNGTEVGTPVLYSATNVPDALVMTPTWCIKSAGTDFDLSIDWFACYQEAYIAN